jgi:hypothetical protein
MAFLFKRLTLSTCPECGKKSFAFSFPREDKDNLNTCVLCEANLSDEHANTKVYYRMRGLGLLFVAKSLLGGLIAILATLIGIAGFIVLIVLTLDFLTVLGEAIENWSDPIFSHRSWLPWWLQILAAFSLIYFLFHAIPFLLKVISEHRRERDSSTLS